MPNKDITETRERVQQLADKLSAMPENVIVRVEGIVEGIGICRDLMTNAS